MPRIYNATFQPFTYEELATPLMQSTQAHQKVEEDYNNNMLVVDSLRQRAANEPNANWSKQIMDYANNLESYAEDLARNGLTRETRNNLLQAKRGYGTTVSPILMAMQREKELQSIRDKNPGVRNVFSQMPSLDEIIANPNAGQNWYSGEQIYTEAAQLAKAASERNVDAHIPENINSIFYRYGKTTGFTNDEIADIEKHPILGPLLQRVYQQYNWNRDFDEGSPESNQLKNEAITGMMAGVTRTEDWHYGQRPDYHDQNWYLQNEKLKRELYPERYTQNSGYQWNPNNRTGISTDYRRFYDPREQKETTDFMNGIKNDKNIVLSSTPNVDGTFNYNISDDYVGNILKGLKGGFNTTSVASSINIRTMGVYPSNINLNKVYSDQAARFGITKDDTVESAKEKINLYLNNGVSYEDMADATQNVALEIDISSMNDDLFQSKYSDFEGKVPTVVRNKEGNYVQDGTIDPKDWQPTKIIQSGNGTYVRVRKKKSSETKLVPYFDGVVSQNATLNYASSVGDQAVLNNKINEEYDYYSKNIRNILQDIDNEDFKQLTRYNKSDVIQAIDKANTRIDSRYNAINTAQTALYNYYNGIMNYIDYQLSINPNQPGLAQAKLQYQEKMDELTHLGMDIDLLQQNIRNKHGMITEGLTGNAFLTNEGRPQTFNTGVRASGN